MSYPALASEYFHPDGAATLSSIATRADRVAALSDHMGFGQQKLRVEKPRLSLGASLIRSGANGGFAALLENSCRSGSDPEAVICPLSQKAVIGRYWGAKTHV